MDRGAWKSQSMELQRVETKQQSNKKKGGEHLCTFLESLHFYSLEYRKNI